MQEITKNELINYIKNSTKESINIKIEGYVKEAIILYNYNLEIINDEIKIKEENFKKYFSFNFNEIRFMGMESNRIIIYIDDEVDTRIEISCQ